MEATQVHINKPMDKEDAVHIFQWKIAHHKKSDILPFVTIWIDLEGITLSEMSQTEEEK